MVTNNTVHDIITNLGYEAGTLEHVALFNEALRVADVLDAWELEDYLYQSIDEVLDDN